MTPMRGTGTSQLVLVAALVLAGLRAHAPYRPYRPVELS